jgi:hypothetical protein
LLQVHDALEDENDDVDGSGSGYGGDDEDDVPTLPKNKLNPKPDLTNGYHSGDGRDDDDNENTENEFDKSHEDPTSLRPIHNTDDDVYFENSTDIDKSIHSNTDDEDSQFIIYLFILL